MKGQLRGQTHAESKDTSNISPHPSLDRPVYAFGPPIQNDVDNNCLHLRCSHCESTIAQMKQLQDTHTKELQQARQESEDLRAGCERKCREVCPYCVAEEVFKERCP